MENIGFQKRAIDDDELAEALGISKPTAYELCNREDFPAIRVTPRRIIIPVDGLQRWLEEQSGGGKKDG